MRACLFLTLCILLTAVPLQAETNATLLFETGTLAPVDSQTHLNPGDEAPDFTLPAISGETVTLSQYRGRKNVMLSFVPAAWTPVCSDQWPGYCMTENIFAAHNTILLGITVDSVPTLHAWTRLMPNLWFPVLSDFWPHGEVARKYGVLRSNGTSERAIFLIDTKGIIRYIDVHDINLRPDLQDLVKAMESLKE